MPTENPHGHHSLTIIFIINGEDVPIEVNAGEPLKAARNKALAESGNTGRPPDEWEVRTEAGVVLNVDQKIGDLGLKSGVRLILSLAAGAGGS